MTVAEELTETQLELEFRHERVDANPPSGRLGGCLTTDLTGNGRDDLIVSSLGCQDRLELFGKPTRFPNLTGLRNEYGRGEVHLSWYENPGWERHDMRTDELNLDIAHTLADIDGDGAVDVVAGQGLNDHKVFWFEQPADPREEWGKHLVTDRFEKYHDVVVDDVDDDGEPELVGLSQRSEVCFYYDIPEDPAVAPWPDEHCHVLAENFRAEGLAVADVDGDGRTEIVAGPNVFHQPTTPGGGWRREPIVTGWDDTRVAVADVYPDDCVQILLTEGDSPYMWSSPGRVAIADPPDWSVTVLKDDMFCPHSLRVADFDGNGLLDIYVAEMGLDTNDDPVHLVFRNNGDGTFSETVVARGIPTHEAKVADLTGDGVPDIAGKSYGPNHHVDVWYNESGR